MTISLNDYQKLVMRTAKSAEGKREALLNIGLGLTGEAGEVADLIKKNAFHGHGLDSSKLIEEAGDVLFYLAWLADTLDVNLEHIADNNIRKLQKRYPEGFSEERSINRDDEDEEDWLDEALGWMDPDNPKRSPGEILKEVAEECISCRHYRVPTKYGGIR